MVVRPAENPYWVHIVYQAPGSKHVSSSQVRQLSFEHKEWLSQRALTEEYIGPFWTEEAADSYELLAIVDQENGFLGETVPVHVGITRLSASVESLMKEGTQEASLAFHYAQQLQQNPLVQGRCLYTKVVAQKHWLRNSLKQDTLAQTLELMALLRERDEVADTLLPVLETLSVLYEDQAVTNIFKRLCHISLYTRKYEERLVTS